MNKKEIGEEFCAYFMERMREYFTRIPEGIALRFSNPPEFKSQILVRGVEEAWPDARLEAKIKKYSAVWWVEGGEEYAAMRKFFSIVIQELEARFLNLLYLQELEKELRKRIEKGHEDDRTLEDFFLGDLLNKEWLTTRYVKQVLREKGLPPLELLVQLSAQKYEKRTVKTRIYFPGNSLWKSDFMVAFEDKKENRAERQIATSNLRNLRKMMEMSGDGQGLLAQKQEGRYYIEGVVSPMEMEKVSPVEVEFTGRLSWVVREDGVALLQCREGEKQIPAVEGDENEEKWRKELKNVMDSLHLENVEKVTSILEVLRKQDHGTSIIFMEEKLLKEEVKRLSGYRRAYAMKPFPMLENEEKIVGISAIDGALLADVDGKCYCVGTILDGKLVIEGNSSRGARFNSLTNYVNWVVEWYKEQAQKAGKAKEWESAWCFVAVMSEDGTVDIQAPEGLMRKMIE